MSIEEMFERLEYIAFMMEVGRTVELINASPRYAEAIRLVLKTHQDAQPNDPLTLEELLEMDGEAVYLAEDRKWYIVSIKFPGPWGNNVPCGVDMWGAGTSLSLLAKCGIYRRPPKED